MVFQNVWYFYLVYINYLVVAYFNVICLLTAKRFKMVGNDIEELADAGSGEPVTRNKQIKQLNFDYHVVWELVNESNEFWQFYIFSTFMWVLPSSFHPKVLTLNF